MALTDDKAPSPWRGPLHLLFLFLLAAGLVAAVLGLLESDRDGQLSREYLDRAWQNVYSGFGLPPERGPWLADGVCGRQTGRWPPPSEAATGLGGRNVLNVYRNADRRRPAPMRSQISSAMIAPMTEPMMPDGWKKPLPLWNTR